MFQANKKNILKLKKNRKKEVKEKEQEKNEVGNKNVFYISYHLNTISSFFTVNVAVMNLGMIYYLERIMKI